MTPMNWTCEQIEARLSDCLDGQLSAEERAAFEAHVRVCAQCAPLFAQVSQLVGELHAMPQAEEAPRLVYAILDKTLGPRETLSGWRALAGWLRNFKPQPVVYGIASVAATFLVIASAFGFSLRKPKLADLSPVSIYRNADRQAHYAYARGVKFVSDLRVVNEVQAQIRDNKAAPGESQDVLPASAPKKEPGSTDGTKPGTRQQNRANGVYHNFEMLAEELPGFVAPFRGRNIR